MYKNSVFFQKKETEYVSIDEILVTTGRKAKKGDQITINYTGHLDANEELTTDFLLATNFNFTLGVREVIAGLDIGIEGMSVGSKRKITCPPSAAYGIKGIPAIIPPNQTIIFDVELTHCNETQQ